MGCDWDDVSGRCHIFSWNCREKRLEQEHGLLSRQIGVLQHQLEQRTEETIKQRQEHSSIILGLQTDLNHKLEEVRKYK